MRPGARRTSRRAGSLRSSRARTRRQVSGGFRARAAVRGCGFAEADAAVQREEPARGGWAVRHPPRFGSRWGFLARAPGAGQPLVRRLPGAMSGLHPDTRLCMVAGSRQRAASRWSSGRPRLRLREFAVTSPSRVALPLPRPARRPTGARFFTRGRFPRVSRSSSIAAQLPWT